MDNIEVSLENPTWWLNTLLRSSCSCRMKKVNSVAANSLGDRHLKYISSSPMDRSRRNRLIVLSKQGMRVLGPFLFVHVNLFRDIIEYL